MSLQVAGHQTEGYRISTEVFEGPLDLLLELIDRAELDITTFSIARVTDQYLAYLQHLEYRDPSEVSAFLVLAARLVQIKSNALLPRPVVVDRPTEEVDDGEALARQLIAYKRFKEISIWLAEREAAGLRTYLRLSPAAVKAHGKADLEGITLADLVLAARQAFHVDQELVSLGSVVNLPRITIREKIQEIIQQLRSDPQMSFRKILKNSSRVEIVVTFLAMLELVKRRIVTASQESLFGDIAILPEGDFGSSEDLEVEYSE